MEEEASRRTAATALAIVASWLVAAAGFAEPPPRAWYPLPEPWPASGWAQDPFKPYPVQPDFRYTHPVDFGDGITASYFNNKTLTAPAQVTRTDAGINFAWGPGAPAPGVTANLFSVSWQGFVEAEFTESYTFHAVTENGCKLTVNNQLLVDRWTTCQEPTDVAGQMAMTAGQLVPIVMEMWQDDTCGAGNIGNAVAELHWESPSQVRQIVPQNRLYTAIGAKGPAFVAPPNNGAGTGFLAEYFNYPAGQVPASIPAGAADFTGTDPLIDFFWGPTANGYSAPPPGIGSGNGAEWFVVRWTGQVIPQFTEAYTFVVRSDDGARLFVNNQLVVDNWNFQEYQERTTAPIPLTANTPVDIRLEYLEGPVIGIVSLQWSSPSTPQNLIPPTQVVSLPPPPPAAGGSSKKDCNWFERCIENKCFASGPRSFSPLWPLAALGVGGIVLASTARRRRRV